MNVALIQRWLLCGSIGVLLLLMGYVAGRIVSLRVSQSSQPAVLEQDTRADASTVQLQAIEDSQLRGRVEGEVRLFVGDTQVQTNGSGEFLVPAGPLLYNYITVVIPDGAQFVASKQGKKYYHISEAKAAQLTPQNRVYFWSALEAEEAGYVR